MYWRVIIITVLFIIPCNVSGSPANYISNVVTKPWLMIDRFAETLQFSFNRSRCTNVYIFGASIRTDNFFNEFVRNYPNSYLIGHSIWECTGIFMISTSVSRLVMNMQFVRTKMSTTEIFIIVDDNVTSESSRIFNVTMYANAEVNIAARNGQWSLSKDYLEPRVFKRVRSANDFKDDTGFANLKGRRLQAAGYYEAPFCYLNTTINRTINNIRTKVFTANNKPELDGVDVNLFLMVAERLNATYTIRQLPPAYWLDTINGKKMENNLRRQMLRKEVDITLTNLWLTAVNYKDVNLSVPLVQHLVHFLVPRPKPYNSFWALISIFTPIVWFAIITMLIVGSLFVYAKAQLFRRRIPKRYQSFAMTWIELMGRLLSTTAPTPIQGLKVVFHLWHVTSILLVTAYSSNLASRLTSSSYEKRIDTSKDFIKANLTWGLKNTPYFSIIYDPSDPYTRQFPLRFVHETNDEETHEKISKGNYAISGKIIGDVYYPDQHISSSDLEGYRLMKQSMASFYKSFAVQPWLLDPVDKIILSLREFGFVDYHLRNVIHRRTSTALREVLIEHDDNNVGPRVLTLIPFTIIFGALVLGLLISTIVFLLELKSVTGPQTTVGQVLADIKKNREILTIREGKMIQVFGRFQFKGRKFGFN